MLILLENIIVVNIDDKKGFLIMKIAVDLLWLRPGKVGGTEFYTRNLLDGFRELDEDFTIVLLMSKDNADSFEHYFDDKRFIPLVANVNNTNIAKRIIWQNLFQNGLLRRNNLRNCFVPVYCRPVFNGGVQYINTIHDIQAYHYPQYHPFHEVAFSKMCWMADAKKSKKLIATTKYVKKDLMDIYHITDDKITVLNIPAMVNLNEIVPFEKIKDKFNIEKKGYYYTVAQMIPHKNLETLIKVMGEIKRKNLDLPNRLLISGISGNATDSVKKLMTENELNKEITLTGFVSNAERNALYQSCRAFLFPSVFEGFGMPPVEAMAFGATVITTDRTSIPEVTQGKANYVDDPFSVEAWISKMKNPHHKNSEFNFALYDRKYLAQKYMSFLKQELKK